jgi:hypothetical protein
MLKSEDEAWAMFENLSNNSRQQVSNRRRAPAPKAPKIESLFEVGHPSDMSTQVVEAITKVDAIAKKLDQLMIAGLLLILLTQTHNWNHAIFVLVLCIM